MWFQNLLHAPADFMSLKQQHTLFRVGTLLLETNKVDIVATERSAEVEKVLKVSVLLNALERERAYSGQLALQTTLRTARYRQT